MSGRTETRYILTCDGCGVERLPAENSIDARAQAAAAGWHFPSRVLPGSGRKSTKRVTDLCAGCYRTHRPATSDATQEKT